MTPGGETGRLLPGEPVVLREHPDWIAVDKPAHMLVHPTKPTGEPTLWHWMQEKYPGEKISLTNRLDRETSGIVLVARGDGASATRLGKMAMRRQIRKEYAALVWGHVLRDKALVDAPIIRQGEVMDTPIHLKQIVHERGAPCRTEYWVVKRLRGCTWLRVRLHSGRLHQIRVHLASVGHPVVGDKIYGPDPSLYLEFIRTGWTEVLQEKLELQRHALHAGLMEFEWDGETVKIESPLPEDIRSLVARAVR